MLTHPDSRRLAVSEDINRDNDDRINNNDGDADSIEGGDDKISTVTDESEKNEDSINSSYRIHRVTWKDADGQTKQIYDLVLDIYINTLANTAMFNLYSYITLKNSRRKSNKQRVSLHICPEWIKAITTQISPNTRSTASDTVMPNLYSLRFSLKRKPDLIGPKGRSLASKAKTNTQLDLLQDLAIVTEFTIHLASSNTITPRQKDFELLAALFSPMNTKNRPSRDNKRANLATLYAGKGGEVKSVARVEAGPPPYASATLGPRPVSSEHLQS